MTMWMWLARFHISTHCIGKPLRANESHWPARHLAVTLFWAHYFANRYGIAKLVVINPMIDPSSNLMKKLGEHFSERRNKTFVVTADAVRSFESVIVPESAETRRLVILSKHDPAIDPEPALETFWNAAKTDLVVYDTDIHTLPLKNHPAMRLIREFILRDYIN